LQGDVKTDLHSVRHASSLHGSAILAAHGGFQASLRETAYHLFMFNNISFRYWNQTEDDLSVKKIPRLTSAVHLSSK